MTVSAFQSLWCHGDVASLAVFAVLSVRTKRVMARPARWLVVMVPKRFACLVKGTVCSGLIA